MPESAPFKLLRDVRFRVLDGEAVVLRQDEGEVLVINEVGARILQLIEAGSSVSEMIDGLLEEFEVERETLEHHVQLFLQELEEGKIIQRLKVEG